MKRISPGTVTVGVMAILFGLVTAYAARHYLNAPPAEPQRPATAAVVRAKVNLPKYGRVREQDLEVVRVPVGQVPEGVVRIPSRAIYRLVKNTVMAGQPVRESDLYGVGEVPMLADQLPPGYRAVTLQVDANSALNGMIQPESYVDVTLTVQGDHPELEGIATLTLLRRVKVLATSEARFRRSEDRPGSLRNITVAASPKQANKLILAQRYGTLSVTLRSSAEDELVADAEANYDLVNPSELLGLAYQPVPQPMEKTAQIWRGGSMQQITFDAAEISEAARTSCKSCNKKKGTPTPAAPIGADAPGTEPPAASPTPAEHRPGNQVVYVRVEAEQREAVEEN